jgi:hypothetical protein
MNARAGERAVDNTGGISFARDSRSDHRDVGSVHQELEPFLRVHRIVWDRPITRTV